MFGDSPTLADAALLGNCLMLEEGEPELLTRLAPELVEYTARANAYRLGS